MFSKKTNKVTVKIQTRILVNETNEHLHRCLVDSDIPSPPTMSGVSLAKKSTYSSLWKRVIWRAVARFGRYQNNRKNGGKQK